jgi:hypothetical protein
LVPAGSIPDIFRVSGDPTKETSSDPELLKAEELFEVPEELSLRAIKLITKITTTAIRMIIATLPLLHSFRGVSSLITATFYYSLANMVKPFI